MLKPKKGHIIGNKVLTLSLVHDIQIKAALTVITSKSYFVCNNSFFRSVLGVKMAFPENTKT